MHDYYVFLIITYMGGKNSDVTVNQFDFGILNFAFYSWLQLNRQTVGGKKNNDVIVNQFDFFILDFAFYT